MRIRTVTDRKRMHVSEILRCYRESFEAENNELALPEGMAAEAPAGYAESVRFYAEQLDSLRNWLRNRVFTEATGELPEQLTESFASWQSRHPELLAGLFRSRTTGYTMLDLLEETELLMRTDLCGAAGFIQMTPVFAGDVSTELEKNKARLDAEENGQQLLQFLLPLAVLGNLCLQQMLHLGVIFLPQHFLVLGEALADLLILPERLHNGSELGVLLGVALPLCHILHGIRVADQRLQLQILIFYGL